MDGRFEWNDICDGILEVFAAVSYFTSSTDAIDWLAEKELRADTNVSLGVSACRLIGFFFGAIQR